MIRHLLPLLALALALLAPASVSAADPEPVSWHRYRITGLVLGGDEIAAEGKLSFSSSATVAATVRCNSIGGDAVETGEGVYTIGGVIATMMACEDEALMNAEAALMKILSAGTLALADGAFGNETGRILVEDNGTIEVTGQKPVDPTAPVVTTAPDPDATALPDPLVIGPTFSIEQCVGVLTEEELAPYLGRPADGAVSSDSGSSGSGSAGGSGEMIEPVSPPVVIEPLPPVVVVDDPVSSEVSPSAPDAKPGTAYTPTAEECRNMLASIRTLGPVDAIAAPLANAASDDAATSGAEQSELRSDEAVGDILAAGLGGFVGGLITGIALTLLLRRRRASQG